MPFQRDSCGQALHWFSVAAYSDGLEGDFLKRIAKFHDGQSEIIFVALLNGNKDGRIMIPPCWIQGRIINDRP